MYKIMQHCFGVDNSGGPINAYNRLISTSTYKYTTLRQLEGANGININLLISFIKKIKKEKPQLIHIRGLGNEGFHALIAAKIAMVPNILVSIHGTHRDLTYNYHPIKRWIVVNILENITLYFATDIVTVCNFASKREFLKPFKKKLRHPISNGVPIPKLLDDKEINVLKDKLNVDRTVDRIAICVSRVTIEKGYLTLAEALKIIDSEDNKFTLLIIGGGDQDNIIKDAYASLNHIDVRFIGHVTNVDEYLSISDFFIFPTFHENLSNALIEAMSHSLPAIATSVGGNTEVIERGGGILVKPNDPKDLALAVKKLIHNPKMLNILGKKARENVISNYSVENMVKSWEDLYIKILEARND